MASPLGQHRLLPPAAATQFAALLVVVGCAVGRAPLGAVLAGAVALGLAVPQNPTTVARARRVDLSSRYSKTEEPRRVPGLLLRGEEGQPRSSLAMVTVAEEVPRPKPPLGPDRLTVKVSFSSFTVSPRTCSGMLRTVLPAGKVTVPLAAT